MRNVIHLEPEQVPPMLKAGYSGRTFKAVIADTVTLSDTYWSGGTRSTYQAVNLDTGERYAPTMADCAPHAFGGKLEGQTVAIPPRTVIVEHSIFCGKDHGITFHARAEDIQPTLPAAVTLTPDEQTVLAAVIGLKSSYGGIPNFRWHEANKSTGITLDRWESAKAALIARGMLNKAGAITTAGRNAIGTFRLR
jgi:hypothetical protein